MQLKKLSPHILKTATACSIRLHMVYFRPIKYKTITDNYLDYVNFFFHFYWFSQERMKSERVNPLCKPYSRSHPCEVILRHDTKFFNEYRQYECCLNVFAQDGHMCKPLGPVHVIKTFVTGQDKLFQNPPGISKTN